MSKSVSKTKHQSMRRMAVRWHMSLALVGGVVLLLWGLSGLLHPMMATFGPQQSVYFPPERPLDLHGIMPIHQILQEASINEALAVKIVVAEKQNLLQVTEKEFIGRRYFSLSDGRELVQHDPAHAVFLARHYLGLGPQDTVRTVERLDDFTSDYPWVNRLLPVYRVRFERDDELTAYIYTQTNTLAGVSNRFKDVAQTAFRVLHTWSWFPKTGEPLRIVSIAGLVAMLFTMALSGIIMLLTTHRRARMSAVRSWHRFGAWWSAVPILMLSGSGVFHLLQYAGEEPGKTLTLSPAISLEEVEFPLDQQWNDITKGLIVNNVSIVKETGGQYLYRLGLVPRRGPGVLEEEDVIRNARFDGVPRTGPALYVDARNGRPWLAGDEELALQLGERFTGVSREALVSHRLVTRFGPEYDFRNKRLPVWQLDYGDPIDATIFVDTTTGVLADRTPDSTKPERLSFSMLHKWNFLFPFGRPVQNVVVSLIVLGSIVFMAILGLRMILVRRGGSR